MFRTSDDGKRRKDFLFQHAFHAAPARYLVFDLDFTILAATDFYLQTAGRTREEIVGRKVFDVFPPSPEDPDPVGERNVRASVERALATNSADAMAVLRYPIRKPEGEGGQFEERHWSIVHCPVLDGDGEVFAILHRVEEVTELLDLYERGTGQDGLGPELRAQIERMQADILLRARDIEDANRKLHDANQTLGTLYRELELHAAEREDALRTSDERYRLLVEGVQEYAIFMLDQLGNVVSWSPTAVKLYGYAEDEILGRHISTFFSPEDVLAGLPQAELREATQHGKVTTRGWRVRKDGSRFWVGSVVTVLYDSDHRVRGFAKVSRDMTEQRRTEAVLESIVNTAVDGIITIDARGTVQTFNRAAEKIFGYEAGEVVGRNVNVLMPEPYHREHDGYLEAYLRTGEAKIIGIGREVHGRRKDGSTFPLELAVSEFDQDGQPCFTGLVRDISARKRMEEQLRQSQKMEAVGQLAAGVAHDFNNLLTVISGYSELASMSLAEGGEVRPDLRPMLNEIRGAAKRASSLTHQLLAFSRRQVLETEVFDLNLVISETEKMLRRLIGEDVDLVTILDAGTSPVRADPGQVVQVVMNLALNARDAMPHGGTLAIETRNVDLDAGFERFNPGVRAGPYVLMTVSDTGCGMTADVRARIFEPFFTTKEVGKGSGLGLSVIDGIVRQSGGHVDCVSEVGVGTVFKVYLPAEREAASGGAAGAQPEGHSRGAETILLVEDDPAVRSLAVLSLKHAGYDVLEAFAGAAALDIVDERQGRIDLLLTDVVMPGMSGRQLAEAVKERYPAMKVLFMSGYTDDSVVRDGILGAEINFLQKPFTPGSLARKVREVLDDKGVDGSDRAAVPRTAPRRA